MVEGDSGADASGSRIIASAVEHAVTKSQELFEQFAARSQDLTGIVDPLGLAQVFSASPFNLHETRCLYGKRSGVSGSMDWACYSNR